MAVALDNARTPALAWQQTPPKGHRGASLRTVVGRAMPAISGVSRFITHTSARFDDAVRESHPRFSRLGSSIMRAKRLAEEEIPLEVVSSIATAVMLFRSASATMLRRMPGDQYVPARIRWMASRS